MLCPTCKATADASDRFCPKCGSGLTASTAQARAAAGLPLMPAVVDAKAEQASRVRETRLPVVGGGRKYKGLTTAADVMIKGAEVVRLLHYILAGLAFVSALMWFRESPGLGFLVGLVLGIVTALWGWLLWLFLKVFGELMYVVMDVEENLRQQP